MDIVTHLEDRFFPSKALIIYENRSNSEAYIEKHTILPRKETKDPYIYSSGEPLEKAEIARILQAVKAEDITEYKSRGIMPANILFISAENIIWWSESKKVKMKYQDEKPFEITIPAMVYAQRGENLFIYFLDRNKRPESDTKLYHAILSNIYEDGRVCIGSIKRPETDLLEDLIEEWENKFWASKFTTIFNLEKFVHKEIKKGFKCHQYWKAFKQYEVAFMTEHHLYGDMEELMNEFANNLDDE